MISTSHLSETVNVPWAGNSYLFGDLSFLPSGSARMVQGSAGWSGFPNSRGLQPCPGPPRVAGGLSRREVHWHRWVYMGSPPSRCCVLVAPIRVAFRRGIDATAVGASPGPA